MNLKEEILAEHSKSQTLRIVNYIGKDNIRFKDLLKLFFGTDALVAQRAAWVVSYCAEAQPDMVKPYLGTLIKNLKRTSLHNAIKRNTMRLFQEITFPRNLMGELTNICFSYLHDVKEAIAVKAFSMTVLLNIAKREPGLKNEIKIVIEDMLPHGTPAIRARGKKVLKEIEKL